MSLFDLYYQTKEALQRRQSIFDSQSKDSITQLLTVSPPYNVLSISQIYPKIGTFEGKIRTKSEIFNIEHQGYLSP